MWPIAPLAANPEIMELWPQTAMLSLVGAIGLDRLVGDPWSWPHPVQAIGAVIHHGSQWILRTWLQPRGRRFAGIGLGIGVILGSAIAGGSLVHLAHRLHWGLGLGLETILIASSLAGRSLAIAAADVLQPLAQGDVATARDRLSRYVGRDTADLSAADIRRALFETVAENATDGVTAPLFYAIVGACLPGIGAVPLAWGYKAASTLDSMIGYRRPPYQDLGWFSARLEDGLTWLPCRLTVGTIALLSGRPRHVLQICQRDAIADPSPNSGWSECVYAAAIGVQVGGDNRYQGVLKTKPHLGEDRYPITSDRIRQALRLTRWTVLIWVGLAILGLALWAGFDWTESLVTTKNSQFRD